MMVDSDGHPEPAEMRLSAIWAALADPLRANVVSQLVDDVSDAERTCVSFELGVARSTLTHHFRVLREAGLVRQFDYGNSRKVRLRREELEERFPGLLKLIKQDNAGAR